MIRGVGVTPVPVTKIVPVECAAPKSLDTSVVDVSTIEASVVEASVVELQNV